MRGLHVVINETTRIRAGDRAPCSLHLNLSLFEDPAVPADLRQTIAFRLSGIVSEDGGFKRIAVWDSRSLVVGDKIQMEVIDAEDFDQPPQMIDHSEDRIPPLSMDVFLLRHAISQLIQHTLRRINARFAKK
jgi:hypothetical protein